MSADHMAPGYVVTDKKIIISIIFLFLLCLVGMMSNGFITAVLGMKWLLRRTLSTYNKLLVSLAASRFCLQWVVMGKNIYIFLHPTAFPYNPALQLLSFLWEFFNALTIWFCTWLGFFYCVKIANLTHSVFLWLKYKVSAWIPWMLLSSMGLSGLTSTLFSIGNQIVYQSYLRSDRQSWNVTRNGSRISLHQFYFFSIKVVMWTVPVVIFFTCMALLLTSLGRHLKKTLLSFSGLQDIRVQAHVKALFALLSFFFLFTSCFLCLLLSSASSTLFWEFEYWMWQVLSLLITAVHPLILLFSNPELRVVLERGCFPMCRAFGVTVHENPPSPGQQDRRLGCNGT